MNCPFDGDFMPVNEYLHNDGLGAFLALHGGMSSCEQYGLHYLTPAPGTPRGVHIPVAESATEASVAHTPRTKSWAYGGNDMSQV
jgi:hypothetical protein